MTKRYCAAPWHGLHINPRGDVKTCCAGNPNVLGNLATHSVDEMLNNDYMREVREEMKQGKFHSDYCRNCINGSGEWAWHNATNPNFDYENASSEYLYPTIFDARWNITCNQSCNYCDSNASSSWAAITGSLYKPETRKHTDSIIDLLNDNKQNVKEVALVGGEPLLLKENIKVLEALQDTKSKVILITNLNVDLESNKLFQLLSKHYSVGWSMSFDNIGQQYDYVRYGGQWEKHEQNVDKIIKLMQDKSKDHTGGIHAVYNLYNCTRLVELKTWANSKGLTILWQQLFGPNALDVAKQNDKIKILAMQEIYKLKDTFELTAHETEFFDTILNNIQSSKADTVDTLAFINLIETEYHPDTKGQFEQLWPEIYQALGPL